jgi:2-polyprenyl-6-methoxyphenol hydroxylase-like FAD-dependent oxidoreductase
MNIVAGVQECPDCPGIYSAHELHFKRMMVKKQKMKTIIIGGGVIGLCSAYYLHKDGHEVTVIDRGDITDGCSFGNMGYMSPSHFIPLASPGIIAEGLRHMLSSSSLHQTQIQPGPVEMGLSFLEEQHGKNSFPERSPPQ